MRVGSMFAGIGGMGKQQGFPKEYKFPDIPQKEIYKQLGNTVCVPVVMRIARRILALE